MAFDFMSLIGGIGDISSRNVEAGYSDAFSAVSDPASFLFNQGMLGQTPATRRKKELEDRQYGLQARAMNIEEAIARSRLQQEQDALDYKRKFRRGMLGA